MLIHCWYRHWSPAPLQFCLLQTTWRSIERESIKGSSSCRYAITYIEFQRSFYLTRIDGQLGFSPNCTVRLSLSTSGASRFDFYFILSNFKISFWLVTILGQLTAAMYWYRYINSDLKQPLLSFEDVINLYSYLIFVIFFTRAKFLDNKI